MNLVKAVSLKLASTMMFALMSAQARYLGDVFPVGEIVFFRGLFALIPIVLFFGLRNELRGALKTSRLSAHLVRGMFSVVGTFCTFGALARLPIADVTAIAFLAPLITVIFAALILKEQVHVYRWSAVVVGFGGVFLMLSPYLSNHAALTTSMAVALLTAPFGWRLPATMPELAILVGIGIAGGLGQMLFTEGYRYAPASFLAPFDYSAMLWAFLLGFWIFGEVPTLAVVGGAAIVAGAGIFVILRERHLGLKRRRDTPMDASAVSETTGDPDAPVAGRLAKAIG